MKKKISLPLVIAIALLAAAIAFSFAYITATKTMNRKLKDLGEKQSLFSTLADVDSYVREKSYYDADQQLIEHESCKGYVEGYEGRVLWFSAEDFKCSKYENAEYTKMNVADGCVIVILTQEQYEAEQAGATEPTETTEAVSE